MTFRKSEGSEEVTPTSARVVCPRAGWDKCYQAIECEVDFTEPEGEDYVGWWDVEVEKIGTFEGTFEKVMYVVRIELIDEDGDPLAFAPAIDTAILNEVAMKANAPTAPMVPTGTGIETFDEPFRVECTFAGDLNPGAPDSVHIIVRSNTSDTEVETDVVETADDSKVFESADSTVHLDISTFGGAFDPASPDKVSAEVTATAIRPEPKALVLHETHTDLSFESICFWANIRINPGEPGAMLRSGADDVLRVAAEKNGDTVVQSDLAEVGGPDSLVFSDGETTVALSDLAGFMPTQRGTVTATFDNPHLNAYQATLEETGFETLILDTEPVWSFGWESPGTSAGFDPPELDPSNKFRIRIVDPLRESTDLPELELKSIAENGQVLDRKPVTFQYTGGAFVSNETFIAYSENVALAEGVEDHFSDYVLIDPFTLKVDYKDHEWSAKAPKLEAFHIVVMREGNTVSIPVSIANMPAGASVAVVAKAAVPGDPVPITVTPATLTAATGTVNITALQMGGTTITQNAHVLFTITAKKRWVWPATAVLGKIYVKVVDRDNLNNLGQGPVNAPTVALNKVASPSQRDAVAKVLRLWVETALGKPGRMKSVDVEAKRFWDCRHAFNHDNKIQFGIKPHPGTPTGNLLSEILAALLHEMSLSDYALESGYSPNESPGNVSVGLHDYAVGLNLMYARHTGATAEFHDWQEETVLKYSPYKRNRTAIPALWQAVRNNAFAQVQVVFDPHLLRCGGFWIGWPGFRYYATFSY